MENGELFTTTQIYASSAEEHLTLLLNSSCLDAVMDGNRIVSIKAWQSNAETFHVISASYFADCSGDSVLAPLTNTNFMYGREAKSQFDERILKSDKCAMYLHV